MAYEYIVSIHTIVHHPHDHRNFRRAELNAVSKDPATSKSTERHLHQLVVSQLLIGHLPTFYSRWMILAFHQSMQTITAYVLSLHFLSDQAFGESILIARTSRPSDEQISSPKDISTSLIFRCSQPFDWVVGTYLHTSCSCWMILYDTLLTFNRIMSRFPPLFPIELGIRTVHFNRPTIVR